MRVKRPALGRGLESLFAPSTAATTVAHEEPTVLRQIPVDEIRSNPFQPRLDFNKEKMSDLADSIRTRGVLQPSPEIRDSRRRAPVEGRPRGRTD